MNIKKVSIAVDFESVLTYDPIKFVQGDYATCEFDFTLADNVLAGESLFVTFILPSGTP